MKKVIATLLLVIASSSAFAGWGAIAYSPSTGNIGYADGYDCYQNAVNAAMGSCGYSDCEIKNWEQDKCNAFATGNGNWGESNGYDNSNDAVNAAINACGVGCSWNAWICN